MRLQLTAYSLTGVRKKVLTQARNINFVNDGTLTFDLPKRDPNIGLFDGDIALGVEIETLGRTEFGALQGFGPVTYTEFGEVTGRFIYRDDTRSRTTKVDTFGFTAPSIPDVMFNKMPAIGARGDQLVFGPDDNPYTVMAKRVADSLERGVDLGITVVDGGGWSTPNLCTNLPFDDLSPLDTFYGTLRDGAQAELVWVGTTLYVLPPGATEINRTREVRFQLTDFSDVPDNGTRSNIAETIIAVGDGGAQAIYPPDAPGRVTVIQCSGISDVDTLTAIAQNEWAKRQAPAREITATLALHEKTKSLPYKDYRPGSLVTIPGFYGVDEQRPVSQITLGSALGPQVNGNVVFGTKFKSTELKLIELGKLAVGGITVISGNGTAS